MNVADSTANLSLLQHVTGIVGAASSSGGSMSPGIVKTATITNYGPDGQQKASVGTISFAGVQFGPDGSIAGGQITHSAATPEGKALSSTTLTLAKGGTPTQAQTQIHNRNDDGVEKILHTDLSSLQWTPGGKISSGEIRLTTQDPTSGLQRSSGTLVYQNEKPASGTVTNYSASDGKSVESQTESDYSGLTFVGHRLSGGQINMTRKTPDQKVSSHSQVQFAPNGFGRIQQVQTTNLDAASGNTKSVATADYSGITFDARNKISAGDIHVSVAGSDQSPLAHSVVSFANSVPSTAQTFAFQNGVLAGKTVTDFSNAKFDNQNRVIGSSVKVDQYDASERLVASTTVNYDANHSVATKNTKPAQIAAGGGTPPRSYNDVINSLPKPASGGAVKSPTTVNPPAATSGATTKQIKRADGTLETTVATTTQNGVPVSAVITHYASDGKTVTSTFQVDLSKVTTSGQKPSGTVSMKEYVGGTTLGSEGSFEYA